MLCNELRLQQVDLAQFMVTSFHKAVSKLASADMSARSYCTCTAKDCCAVLTASSTLTLFKSDVLPHHRALLKLLRELPQDIKDHVTSLCIDGTSSTALLVDSRRGDILAPTKIYNEDQGSEPLNAIKVISVPFRAV